MNYPYGKIQQMKQIAYRIVVVGLVLAVIGTGNIATADTKSPPAGSTFEQRLAQRKKEQNIKLEKRDQARIEQRCVSAQTAITSLQQQLSEPINTRHKQYKNIDAKVWIAVGQLKLAGQDTFTLEKHQISYNKQRVQFEKLTAEYVQTLDDAVVINCKADPVGFVSLIETARSYLDQIRTQSEAIRTTTVNNVKPELNNMGAKL